MTNLDPLSALSSSWSTTYGRLLITLTLVCGLGCWLLWRRLGQAAAHDGVSVVTLANHKGGVGKTTVAFLLAKNLATHSDRILVVDCSLYGDISRLLLGPTGARVRPSESDTIEGFASRYLKGSAGCCSKRCASTPKIEDFARRSPHSENTFVLTSAAQSLTSDQGVEECMHGSGAALVAKGLRDMLARDYQKNGKAWTVVVDTDGGLTHGMTRLALCLADSVTVPVNADVDDIRRLRILLKLMQSLRQAGHCVAEVAGAFFNNLPVKNNEPTAEAAAAGLQFTTHAAHLACVEGVEAEFERLSTEYPQLMPALATQRNHRNAEFFSCIRSGGTSLQKAKVDPSCVMDSQSFAEDIDRLAARVLRRLPTRKLF